MNKIQLTSLLLLVSFGTMAQTTTQTDAVSLPQIMLAIIVIMLLFVMILLIFTLNKVVYILKKETLGESYDSHENEQTTWEKLLSLKPLAAEKEIELDHDYDGIKELNNPIPFWFNLLFAVTIVVGVLYFLVYHVFESAPLQAKEYETELIVAEAAKQEYIKKAGNLIDENSVTQLKESKLFAGGVELYTTKCAVCHGEKGEGKVGPNLTDAYWIHGGDVQSIFKTIKYGVPSKGMVAWQNSLNGAQMQQLASYIMSMQGSNPPGAKEAQGNLYQVTDSLTQATADSIKVIAQ